MSRIGFYVFRQDHFKVLGGVIDECLARKHETTLFFDGEKFEKNLKGMEAPSLKNLPNFKNGKPEIVVYEGVQDLVRATVRSGIKVLVLHCGLTDVALTPVLKAVRAAGIKVVSLYSHFYDNCLLRPEHYDLADRVCVLSEFALDAHMEILRRCRSFSLPPGWEANMREKTRVTGSALFDFFFAIYERRKNAANAQNEALFFYPKVDFHPFMQLVVGRRSKFIALVRSLTRYRGRYLNEILNQPKLDDLLESVSSFVQRNDLKLVVKSRPKHGLRLESPALQGAEVHTGSSDTFYPIFTSADLQERARVAIQMRSFSVLESVIAGVPSIFIDVPIIDRGDNFYEQMVVYTDLVRGARDGSMFSFPGVVTKVPWKESAKYFSSLTGSELNIDRDARTQYVKKYCGYSERTAAVRQMDEIESIR